MSPKRRPGTEIRRVLSSFGVMLSEGCQRSQLLDYMDRIGANGCEERFDSIVDSLLADTKNWRSGNERIKVTIPTRETIEDLLRWAIE